MSQSELENRANFCQSSRRGRVSPWAAGVYQTAAALIMVHFRLVGI